VTLSGRTILPLAAGLGLFVALVVVGFATSPGDKIPNDDWRVILLLVVGLPAVVLGLLGTGFLVRREMRRQLAEFTAQFERERLVGAVVALHYRGYRGGTYAKGVGGFFALTSAGVTFQTRPSLHSESDVRIPFEDMTEVVACGIGPVARGFRVERTDGSAEYFQIGPAFGDRSKRAAEEIEEWRRYRRNPGRRPEPPSWTDR
jgi:hypothetical protein